MLEDIKTEIQYLLKIKEENLIAKQLQKINDLFLTQYKLKIDDIEIIPLETEIYYYKSIFEDNMIHLNPLQKNRFGKLYFHRTRNTPINFGQGGIDICISDKNFYLSILLRTILLPPFNNDNLICGIHNIQKIFYNNVSNKKDKIKELENETSILAKRTENINIKNIFHQKRIEGKNYKESEIYNLNSLNLGEKIDGEYSYLKELKSGFYTDERKKDIKKKFGEKNNGK